MVVLPFILFRFKISFQLVKMIMLTSVQVEEHLFSMKEIANHQANTKG